VRVAGWGWSGFAYMVIQWLAYIVSTLWSDTFAADGASKTVRLKVPGMTARIGSSLDTHDHWLVLKAGGMASNRASAEAAEDMISKVSIVDLCTVSVPKCSVVGGGTSLYHTRTPSDHVGPWPPAGATSRRRPKDQLSMPRRKPHELHIKVEKEVDGMDSQVCLPRTLTCMKV
jgi:hypothetical protein